MSSKKKRKKKRKPSKKKASIKKMPTKEPCIDDFLKWWFGEPLYKILKKKVDGVEEL